MIQSATYGQSMQLHEQLVQCIEVIDATNSYEEDSFRETVVSRMQTKEGYHFSQTEFDSDLKALACEFEHVEPSVDMRAGKINITLKVWPKPSIQAIRWFGNNKMETYKLQTELGIKPGVCFNRIDFNQAFYKIKLFYVKKGFFEVDANYSVTRDPNTNEVEIDICIDEGRCGHIRNICFENFTEQEECEILSLLVTKQWNYFLSFFSDQGTYKEEMIQHDQFQILNYLQNNGYADAKVNIQVCQEECDDYITLRITADKGNPYYFGNITFSGNSVYDNEEIENLILTHKGCLFSPELLRDTATRISDCYGKNGYIDAFVDFEMKLDPNTRCYHIEYKIEEGNPYCVGLIKVFGNCRTNTSVILHECLLVPGETFNILKLKATEARLLNIGYFSCVNVYAVRPDEASGFGNEYRNVHIEIEETSTGSIGAFAGYSTVESIFAGANITEKNFNIAGLPCLITDGFCGTRFLRGGGEYAHITATVGKKNSSYILSWTKPYFLDTPWIIGFDLDRTYNNNISEFYKIKSWGLTVNAKYPINYFSRFGWHYRMTDSRVVSRRNRNNSPNARVGSSEEVNAENAEDDEVKVANKGGANSEKREGGFVSGTGVSLTYDSTNNPHFATCGFRSTASLEYVGLGGDAKFVAFSYVNTYYAKADACGVLKFRADIRFLQPLFDTKVEDIPLDEKLFLGGDTTLRGFRSYAVGPKFNNGAPKGGVSMMLFSVEYLRPLNNRFDFFAFADAGQLTCRPWHLGDLDRNNGRRDETIKSSVGFGARMKMFEGGPPLVLGMGFPLNAASKSDTKRFFLSLGTRF